MNVSVLEANIFFACESPTILLSWMLSYLLKDMVAVGCWIEEVSIMFNNSE